MEGIQKQIADTAAEGLDYADTLTLFGCRDTVANKKAWTLGSIKFKLALLATQVKSPDVRMLIHLGKHYLGQERDAENRSGFDVEVVLDGETA